MAQYRLSVNVISRSTGRSATAAAAYRAGIELYDERTGLHHDYTRKGGVMHTEIMTPPDAPDWMHDRAQLYNAIEKTERRKDAQLVREIQLSLPHELPHQERISLARDFIQEQCVDRGMVADLAIHAPDRAGDERNYHAHVLLSMRNLFGDGFGKKNRDWNDKAVLEEWRERWAQVQNARLEKHAPDVRVDHRSLADQGIDRMPQKHLGPVANDIERKGRQSHRGDENRAAARFNGKVIDLETALQQTEQRMKWEKRKFDLWAQSKREVLETASKNDLASMQLGISTRMEGLRRALDDEFGDSKDNLTAEHDDVAGRLMGNTGWRQFIRNITGRTDRDREEMAELEAEIAEIEAEKQRQLDAAAAKMDQAKAALQAQQQLDSTRLEAGIQKAKKRREGEGWVDDDDRTKKPPERPQKPLQDEFDRVSAQRDAGEKETDDEGTGTPPAPRAKDAFDDADESAKGRDHDRDH